MKPVYINSAIAISPQKTFDNSSFLDEVSELKETAVRAIGPNFRDYIPPAAARRMAKGIKMGVAASKMAVEEAGIKEVDAIITGTGMGCTVDSEKFLSALIDNEEQYLTPTSFIQSTHNTVAGQIALALDSKSYNFTYVHAANSFESALLDAKMQLENQEAENILTGGVDEIADHTIKVHREIGHVKSASFPGAELLKPSSPGAVFSEGASFFVLSATRQNSSYAEVAGVKLLNSLNSANLPQQIEKFLAEHSLSFEDVGAVVLGNNGDSEFDKYYHKISEGVFKNTPLVYYKHLTGENNTVSSFGFWLAARILKEQKIPDAVQFEKKPVDSIKTVLCYNQYRGLDHSLILLKKC